MRNSVAVLIGITILFEVVQCGKGDKGGKDKDTDLDKIITADDIPEGEVVTQDQANEYIESGYTNSGLEVPDVILNYAPLTQTEYDLYGLQEGFGEDEINQMILEEYLAQQAAAQQTLVASSGNPLYDDETDDQD